MVTLLDTLRAKSGALPQSPQIRKAQPPRYLHVVEMTPEQWRAIPDNIRQRDTAAHAVRAQHLRVPHPVHAKVNAAQLPNGDLIKLDGHTRDFLWSGGEVEAPPVIYVDIWACASIAEAAELYSTFDSKAAVDSVFDDMYGALREYGIEFKSELLRSNRYADAMRTAHELMFGQVEGRTISIFNLVKYWKPELFLLDAVEPGRKRFRTGIVAGALITLRRFGPEASEFWNSFARNSGSKVEDEMDAVHALDQRAEKLHAQKMMNGRSNKKYVVEVVLAAFDRYKADQKYSTLKGGGIKVLQVKAFNAWIAAAKETRRSW